MNRTVFFVVFLALVGVVIYALFTAEKSPEKGLTMTPKEYIELVEQKKAERREEEKDQETREAIPQTPAR